ncbi:type IV secretory system conjugative DNA transfer family protein [Nocardioides humi]
MAGRSDPQSLPRGGGKVVFARIYPPRPLPPAALEQVLVRLASDATSAPVVFEVRSRADAHGSSQVSYWIGTTPPHLRWLRRTLHDLLPGLLVDAEPLEARRPVTTAARVKVRPRGLALAVERPEAISTAILSALNQQLYAGEELVLQLVFGPRRAPRHVRGKLADPGQPWWTLPTTGVRDAPAAVVRQHSQRALQAGMATCIRLGAITSTTDNSQYPEQQDGQHTEQHDGPQSSRRHRLLVGLLAGISVAKAPNTYLSLVRDSNQRLDQAQPPRSWDFAPAAAELVGLMAWPLGDGELPGLPSLHPKLLPVSSRLRTADGSSRSLGVSNVPGDAKPIPLTAADGLFHLIATGPTGAGKSTALLHLIGDDVHAGRAVVVIDPKWQLVRDVTERTVPEHRLGDVVVLDPREEQVPGFNPLDIGAGTDGRDPDVVVDGLLAVFAAVFAEGWGPRTQDITHAGLLTLARAGVRQGAKGRDPYTLLDLPRLFTDSSFRRTVVGHVTTDPALGPFWAAWEALSPQAQSAALAAPSNKWRQYLMRPAVRRILGQPRPAFRLRDVFKEKKILLVALNEGLIGPITAQLLGGLIVAEMWAATLERAAEPHPEKHPASVWVDEVQNYLHLPTSLDDALNASRSMGVSWNLAHQFRAQMPAGMLAAVDSNARTKLVFRPGDPKDAAAYARMAPELDALDFLALGKHEAYATVVAGGEQQQWCSLKTLPPPEPTGLGDRIREAARQRYGSQLVPDSAAGGTANNAPADAGDGASGGSDRPSTAENGPAVVGRKRRRPAS